MKFYDITYMLDDEQEKKLSALAEYYKRINGWNEKDVLQFACSTIISRFTGRTSLFL